MGLIDTTKINKSFGLTSLDQTNRIVFMCMWVQYKYIFSAPHYYFLTAVLEIKIMKMKPN